MEKHAGYDCHMIITTARPDSRLSSKVVNVLENKVQFAGTESELLSLFTQVLTNKETTTVLTRFMTYATEQHTN